MANPVVHFEISGKSGKKLTSFYKKVFGWKIKAAPGGFDYGMIAAGGKDGIPGGISGGDTKGVTFYVAVKDLDATLKAAVKAGGKIVVKPYEVPGFGISLAMFKDIEGNKIGIMK